MNVISSLLKLQENSIEDDRIKEALKEGQGRIFAMSAVHESLYGTESLAEIDLKTYLSKISGTLIQTYSLNPGKVKYNIEKASPLGLTVNELISNSLKCAFTDDQGGEILVNIKQIDEELELIVKDDGVGIPDKLDWKNSNTLGLKLIRTLVENQLDGSIDMENNNGTKFTTKFNMDET